MANRRTSVRRRRTYRKKFKADMNSMLIGGAIGIVGMIMLARYRNKQLQPK